MRVAIQLSEKRGRLGIAWLNELEGSIRGSGKFVRARSSTKMRSTKMKKNI